MTRKLRPDELELWQQVARTTDRMGNQPLYTQAPEPVFHPQAEFDPKPEQPQDIPAFRVGQSPRSKPVAAQASKSAPTMDAKAFGRLKRGKLKPEARIDLHGMTLDQAHPALSGFIMTSQSMGRRLVLVITGKGKEGPDLGPIPRRRGVLRQQVPQWLKMAPVGQAILDVTQAHDRHGGGGAFYVYLRRNR